MRVWYVISYLLWLARHIISGAAHETMATLNPKRRVRAAIIEFPLRCGSDLEVTAFTASVAVTPGSQVVGMSPQEDGVPITVFVHGLDTTRQELDDELSELQDRLLLATRGRRARQGDDA